SGVPELQGLPNTLEGYAQAWSKLRQQYAPKVLLGYAIDDFGAGYDISGEDPSPARAQSAGRAGGQFFGAGAQNSLDFISLEIQGDGYEAGNAPNPGMYYSTQEKELTVSFIREFVKIAKVPMVLEGVPLGNTLRQAINNQPYHWSDTWLQWLVKD